MPPSPSFSANSFEKEVVFVKFRYIGQRGMAVTGGVSGRKYRFFHSGDEVLIDSRDVPGMAAVPNVERVFDE